MIPKQAIEKAIEGGWMPVNAVQFAGCNRGVMREGGEPTMQGWAVFNREGGSSFTVSFCDIALDPTFWQALGKALGWGYETQRQAWVITVGDGTFEGMGTISPAVSTETAALRWDEQAHRFYDLILTGGDTETYWNNLLTV